jgi:2-methylisocitrate lyase-like PEP mutase family enzyme
MEPLPVARGPRADNPAVPRRGSALRRAATFRDGGAQVTEAAAHASRERVTALRIRRLAVPMPAFVTSVAQRAGRPVRRAH